MDSDRSRDNLKCDIAIVGGGLAGGLIALALARLRPELKLVLIDQDKSFGGNHIWSFFASDIAPEHRWLTAPLVTYGWSGYEVHFPAHSRSIDNIYYTIESERLDWLLRNNLPQNSLFSGREVKAVSPRLVVLDGAQRINAGGVIDARGAGDAHHLDCGWQKFTGQLLQLKDPHDMKNPIIMDATVEQYDGYRFVYVLPFGMDKVFVEDTYYSDRPDFDPRVMRRRIAAYAEAKGWQVDRVVREETGVLPVVMGGDLDNYWASGSGRTAKAGARGAFFHPVTSYSLPDAVRNAIFIAEQPDLDGDKLNMLMRQRADAHWKSGKFYRMLNRMMFRASMPNERYKVLERFYTLKPGLIERFYSGSTTGGDKARILSGKPPVPVGKAIRALRPRTKKR
ncbi:MAG: lycopene beta-cyclase CrtY [Sphingomonadales bacterium]|jgi:lycopene beta-cyclase|uniref:lycopene beta-cyclase CrtY n=1 Tax=Sphingorhabdus sp. TaxID=1902408 RepID=UPI003BB051BD|nr:lycopene beta-cyclase CrtY [Sphingomonadales bacterium]